MIPKVQKMMFICAKCEHDTYIKSIKLGIYKQKVRSEFFSPIQKRFLS